MKECMKARPNPTAKFNYAWALIRSKEVRRSASSPRPLRPFLFTCPRKHMLTRTFFSVLRCAFVGNVYWYTAG